MPRFKLIIEYAGTRFSGWQVQKNARTIQGEIARAVETVTGRQEFELYGSGRTDAGVHAAGQVAHLDVVTTLPADTLRRRVNDELPADINILAAKVVAHRFHARHDAVARRYVYQIARRRTAFAKPFVWWVKEPLDVALMRDAARAFVGMHDFASFIERDARAPGAAAREDAPAIPSRGRPESRGRGPAISSTPGSSRVMLDRVDVEEYGPLVLVGVEGSHFLWKMVRRIVGVLVEVGRGGLTSEAAGAFLTARSALPAKLTAPASGLFLTRVYYEGERRTGAINPVTPFGAWSAESSASPVPSTRRTTSE